MSVQSMPKTKQWHIGLTYKNWTTGLVCRNGIAKSIDAEVPDGIRNWKPDPVSRVADVWNMACPNCGRDDSISIAATAWGSLTPSGVDIPVVVRPDDGSDANDNAQAFVCVDRTWTPDSAAMCVECRHEGVVRDFTKEPTT